MSNTGGKKYETYTQAVEAACRGDQEAFTFLYESTYRDKYFIAWKYMRKEEDAQDVLQDAYMKAWENLATLKEPEKFPGWLSMIVANTALNALKKRRHCPSPRWNRRRRRVTPSHSKRRTGGRSTSRSMPTRTKRRPNC